MFFITFRRLRFLALRQLMATYMHRTGRKDSAMLHLPFEDRVEAGRLLARELSSRWPGRKGDAAVVLGLTRGGVPVAFAVADRLLLPLDVVVARKLGVPWQPELAMGAIAGSTQVLDKRAIGKLAITEQELNEVLERERAEMTRREELYRAGAPLLDLHGQTAILVDDGLATGSTMAAAVRHVRSLGTARVIVAVPVGSREACNPVAP
jgi:putative phosphoribosyl transferase